MDSQMTRVKAALLGAALLGVAPAVAQPAFSCAGFAILGGAQLLCSHTDPEAPTQICTFSWNMMSTSNTQTMVNGSFILTPGLVNAIVYQGNGFAYALSNPIVLCQGRKTS
jgi:hypothetical protein